MPITTISGAFATSDSFIAAEGTFGALYVSGGTYALNYLTVATDTLTVATDPFGEVFNDALGYIALDDADVRVQPANEGYSPRVAVGVSGFAESQATGRLDIENGSVLEIANNTTANGNFLSGGYNNILIGNGVGGTGTVTVDGGGSQLLLTGGASRLSAGEQGGDGTVNITNGGFIGTFDINVGEGTSAEFAADNPGIATPLSVGRLNISGAGSELRMSSEFGYYGAAYAGTNGYGDIGRGVNGKGYLSITDGGRLTVENEDGISDQAFFRFGRDSGAYGYGIVSGAGSTLQVEQKGAVDPEFFDNNVGAELQIGQEGTGRLIVEDGGRVNVLGDDANLVVSLGERRSVGQTVTPTNEEQSALIVRDGGRVLVDSGDFGGSKLVVGARSEANGLLLISGTGSIVEVKSDVTRTDGQGTSGEKTGAAGIIIGRDGRGELRVENGGQLILDAADDDTPLFEIGRGSTSGTLTPTGKATITGDGSSVTLIGTNTDSPNSSGIVFVGRRKNAEGELNILDGARFSNAASNSDFLIANDPGSRGVVTVDGAGSTLEAGTRLGIGVDIEAFEFLTDGAGSGLLTISDGGTVTADTVTVGRNGVLDADGSVVGDVDLFGDLAIGDDTVGVADLQGKLTVNAGAVISFDVDGFGAGQADLLRLAGDAELDLRRALIDLDLAGDLAVSAGDEVALVEATGTLTATDRFVYDRDRGLEFLLTQKGDQLVLVAQEDSAAPALGSTGNDTLIGTADADSLFGGEGDDLLQGLGGDDLLFGGDGADSLEGGTGIDLASYNLATERVQVDLQGSTVTRGEAVGDTFAEIEGLQGSRFNDSLRGDMEDNTLLGETGVDRLFGRGGDDVLIGGLGVDVLYGNTGADTMTGNQSNDRYVYFTDRDSGVGSGNRDVITDFNVQGRDRIEISRLDADTTRGGNQAFDFIGAVAFSNTAGELRANQVDGNTILEADLDGDGASDFEIELSGIVTLSSSDFIL
ncbi:MAG: hypothetical protein AAFR17_16925 [Pseudomonadota bacterium]